MCGRHLTPTEQRAVCTMKEKFLPQAYYKANESSTFQATNESLKWSVNDIHSREMYAEYALERLRLFSSEQQARPSQVLQVDGVKFLRGMLMDY